MGIWLAMPVMWVLHRRLLAMLVVMWLLHGQLLAIFVVWALHGQLQGLGQCGQFGQQPHGKLTRLGR